MKPYVFRLSDAEFSRRHVKQGLRAAKWTLKHWIPKYVDFDDDIPPGLLWQALQIAQLGLVLQNLRFLLECEASNAAETEKLTAAIAAVEKEIDGQLGGYEYTLEMSGDKLLGPMACGIHGDFGPFYFGKLKMKVTP